jgi:hypothetical protein
LIEIVCQGPDTEVWIVENQWDGWRPQRRELLSNGDTTEHSGDFQCAK